MQLALPFKLHGQYNDEAAEFNIVYDEELNSKERLKEFVEQYSDKRINIDTQNYDLELFNLLQELGNIALRLTIPEQMIWISELKKNNIPFFFDANFLSATDLYSFDYLASLGVSDIYISNMLFYQLSKVKVVAASHHIHIRFILNRIASTFLIQNLEKAPWFPPDAFDIANYYIDIYEFDCGDPYDWHKFNVYYKAWIKDKSWYGNLQEIIDGLDIPIPDTGLFGYDWIKYKTQCDFKCSNANSTCTRCEQFVRLARALREKNIMINRDFKFEGEDILKKGKNKEKE